MRARQATPADAEAIAAIYNEGIADGIATFETQWRTADDVTQWFGGRFPVVAVENRAGEVIAFASTSEYRPRECYAGFWKLVSRVFVENAAGRTLMRSIGFREVGIYEHHAQLRSIWRDVVIVEGLLIQF